MAPYHGEVVPGNQGSCTNNGVFLVTEAPGKVFMSVFVSRMLQKILQASAFNGSQPQGFQIQVLTLVLA